MKFKNVIGIDISKNTIDVYDHLAKQHNQFTNSNKVIRDFLKWVESLNNLLVETLFVYEHTGMYSHTITEYLSSKTLSYFVAPALDIKRSMCKLPFFVTNFSDINLSRFFNISTL